MRALRGDVDIMVSDVIMPKMHGPALVEEARLIKPDLPVLYISGYAPDALARNGLKGSAMSDLLMKPFRPEALAGRVRSMLDEVSLRETT